MSDDKIIERIAKLLAQAEHPSTSDTERDAFITKADEMMAKHMIDEALVRLAQAPAERRKPVRVDVELFDRHSTYGIKMGIIATEVARTVGVRMATRSSSNIVSLVGFDEDVRWMQMLFLNVQMAFLGRMRPEWSSDRSLGHNVALLRESGMGWPEVSKMAFKAGATEDYDRYTGTFVWSDRLAAAYKKHCKATGATPVTITRHEAYRATYVEAFTNRICMRLTTMRLNRLDDAKSTGSELALRSVENDVNDAFHSEFPNLSPAAHSRRMAQLRKEQEQADTEHAAWLSGLTPTQRLSHERKQAEEADKQARRSDKYWAQRDREQEKLYDSNGAKAGRKAADGVNLSTAETVDSRSSKELS